MKKNYILLIILVLILLLTLIPSFISWLFRAQYNSNGVSHFLVITVDKNSPKQYVGDLDNHEIYVEKLNLKETCFINVKAENVPIKKALEENLVSIADWRKYANKVKKYDNVEILQFENYEIVCYYSECVIRPI